MDKNTTPAGDNELGLGVPNFTAHQSYGLTAPVEYSGHPADGSNPSISTPAFPPTKGA